jgi:SAM-dependent methyltransferase
MLGRLQKFADRFRSSQHQGFDIPLHLLKMTGGGPETFDAISEGHIRLLQEHIGIEPHHSVLEVGCGVGRDAIPLSRILTTGQYLGIDIIKESIDWCAANIAHSNFRFVHFDIADKLHNRCGSRPSTAFRFPVADRSIDRIFLWSVFTHMARPDIEHYLREFSRVLKPTGKVYATWFMVDDAILAKARTVDLTPYNLRFEHQFGPGCYINNLRQPMGAVAYSRQAVMDMIAQAGLRIEGDILPGSWSGFWLNPLGGQDATVLTGVTTQDG